MEQLREASAVTWRWRDGDRQGALRQAHEAATARKRGALGGVIGLLAAGAALLLHRPALALAVGGVAVIVTLLALLSPLFLYRRLMVALDLFAHAVGTAVTWALMTVLFYLLFLPMGLLLRATGKLDMARFAEPGRPSYWTPTDGRPRSSESYRKQF